MGNIARKLYQRVTNFGLAFMLAVSSLAVVGPFIATQDARAATTVNSQSELVSAISGSDTVIELGSSFTIYSQVNINRNLTLDGNGYTLSAASGWIGSASNDSVLSVGKDSGDNAINPTIKSLTIDGALASEVQGLQVWQSGATLHDIESKNNQKAGIHVNGSVVNATNITTSNNSRGKSTTIFGQTFASFGGILVSSGTLNISGLSEHSAENNQIRRDGGVVNDIHSQYSTTNLIFYTRHTLKQAPAAPVFQSPTPAHNSTIIDTQTVTVAWSKPSYASTFEYRINGGSPVATSDQSFTQNFVNGNYDIEVRSVAASGLKGGWSVVRSFTMSYYSYNVNDSKFVSSPKYIQANGAHADHNISAEVHVPELTDDVRFSVDGGAWVAGTYHNAVNTSLERWRLITPLTPGEYTITAQYRVNGEWHNVTGSGVVYSIDTPTAQYVLPSATSNVFRGEDNPVRLKVEDQHEQFSRMVVKIGSSNYEVLRADCDVRQAGNYLLCDVDQSAAWAGLPSGTYTALTTTYTKANNRVNNLVSLPFTIDNDKPVVTSLTAPNIVSGALSATATATDNENIESVNFYITEPRADGVCTGNGTKLVHSRVFGETAGLYGVTLNTSSLDGIYCLSAQARDNAQNNSVIMHKKVIIDNLNPVVEITNLLITTGADKKLSFDLKATDENSGLKIVSANIYDASNSTQVISLGLGSPTRLNSPHSGLAVGTGIFETSLSNIDVSGLASGTYTIRAFARDHASNEHRFLLYNFTVDNTAPAAPVLSVTDLESGDSTNQYSITASWTQPSDDTVRYQYRYWNNISTSAYNDKTKAWETPGNLTSTSRTGNFDQGQGTHYIEVRATDEAGNWSDWSNTFEITYDNTAPIITLNGDANVSVEAGSSYDELGATATDNIDTTLTVVTSGIVDATTVGPYAITYSATDSAGNTGTATRAVSVVDTTAPIVTIDALDTPGSTPTLTGTIGLDAVGDITVTIGTEVFVAVNNLDGTWSLTIVDPLSTGSHDVTVEAEDAAGNVGTATANITVEEVVVEENDPETTEDDETAPQTTVTPTPPAPFIEGEVNGAQDENGDQDVAAAQDDNTNGDENENNDTLLGLAWYWWLAILAAVAALWWLIAGALRRRNNEEA